MVTRLSGGLTPADGADPRTFPAIWNVTATEIETAQSDILDRVVKNNRSGGFFTITGERNGNVGAGSYWAWGNGGTTNKWPVLYNCVIVGAALWAKAGSSGTITVQMEVNGVAQGTSSQLQITGGAGDVVATTTFATPVSLTAGDSFTPVCTANTGTSTASTISLIGYWV